MSRLAESLKVFVEWPDGNVFEITGMASAWSIEVGYDRLPRMTIEVVGEGVYSTGSEIIRRANGPEWRCDHCSRVNSMKRTTCEGCGACRSFIYGGAK